MEDKFFEEINETLYDVIYDIETSLKREKAIYSTLSLLNDIIPILEDVKTKCLIYEFMDDFKEVLNEK